jgi:hypothetical protein
MESGHHVLVGRRFEEDWRWAALISNSNLARVDELGHLAGSFDPEHPSKANQSEIRGQIEKWGAIGAKAFDRADRIADAALQQLRRDNPGLFGVD